MENFYSEAWMTECKNRMNDSDLHKRTAKRLDGIIDFRIWEGPDGKDRAARWEFENGICRSVTCEANPSPSKELREAPLDENSLIRFSGAFETMARVHRRDMIFTEALVSPGFTIEGDKTMLWRMKEGFKSFNESNTYVECNYDFRQTDGKGNRI